MTSENLELVRERLSGWRRPDATNFARMYPASEFHDEDAPLFAQGPAGWHILGRDPRGADHSVVRPSLAECVDFLAGLGVTPPIHPPQPPASGAPLAADATQAGEPDSGGEPSGEPSAPAAPLDVADPGAGASPAGEPAAGEGVSDNPGAYPGIAISIDERKNQLSVIVGDMALDRAQASEDVIRNTDEARLNHLLEMDLATDDDREALHLLYAAKSRVSAIYGFGLKLQRAIRDMDGEQLDAFDPAAADWPT